jgi:xanthine dehydrogenase small subunit
MIPAYFLGIKKKLQEMQVLSNGQPQNGNAVKYLGGGTDLYVQQHDTIVHEQIDFLFDKQHLNGISQRENICEMGASATAADIAGSPIFKKYFNDLNRYIKLVSSTQIRNMATVAGNFTNASPIGDFTIFFLALDAKILLSEGENHRTLPLREFYKGYKQLNKKPAEIIERISFELPGELDLFNFEKVSKRTYLDIASVNTAIYLKMKDDQVVGAGLSAGGVGPVPAYLKKASDFLEGKRISAQLIHELVEIAQTEITPISDARGTEKYKRLLLSQLIKAHFISLFPSLPLLKLVHA